MPNVKVKNDYSRKDGGLTDQTPRESQIHRQRFEDRNRMNFSLLGRLFLASEFQDRLTMGFLVMLLGD
jgi:hypothetical protein